MVELFMGAGGLTRMAVQLGGKAVTVLSALGQIFHDADLAVDSTFESLLGAYVGWMHKAPCCKTFTQARRSDHFGSVRFVAVDDQTRARLEGSEK